MKLTERDKTLLFILAVICILCLPYFFAVQPYTEKTHQLENEVKELQMRKKQLLELENRREEFIDGIQKAKESREELLTRFPSQLPQEGSILFLHNTEERIPITLSQVAFEMEEMQIITGNEAASQENAAGQEADGSGALQSGVETGSESTAAVSNLAGTCASSQIIYSAGYKNLKDFLEFILNHKDRMVISSLNAVYSADMNVVTGNLTLRQYAIKGGDRAPVQVAEPDVMHGTSNVFMQASGIAPSGEIVAQEADFFLMLSQPEADIEAAIFGKSKEGSEETYLTSGVNDMQEMAISFKGSDGEYIANYQIGDEKYSANGEGIVFEKEGDIVFEVISSPRVGDTDKVAASLDIINKTDRTVIVVVKNEDGENPRVTIAGKTGTVTVKE